MAKIDIFVGRRQELEQFKDVLKNPRGQVVLVVGQVGMGKTWLLNKMAQVAENYEGFKCGWVRYEVTPTDGVDSVLALMMDNAFEAAHVREGTFDPTHRRLEQWRSLLNVIKVGDLVKSLRRDPEQNTRDQFLNRLELVSSRMKENQRLIFIIDPEKYMQENSDQVWAIVAKRLPEKIKFVFAQRPDDVLVGSETFDELNNVVCIPKRGLDVLDEDAVDELLERRSSDLDYSVTELHKALKRYKGHPYAIAGALDLIEAGTPLTKLPADPTPTGIAKLQRKKVCKYGEDVIRLFEVYATLEVDVPDEVVEAVSGDSLVLERVLEDSYLGPLLREESRGRRIYHTILADHFREKIKNKRKKKYHHKAVKVYREQLSKEKRLVALAAMRLPEHVLAAEGQKAFVYALVNECVETLLNLGFFDTVKHLCERALEIVDKGTIWHGAVLGNLGLIYMLHEDLDKAEELVRKSLQIAEQIGCLKNMPSGYGNLGLIYMHRNDLDKAEDYLRRALEIYEQIGNQEGVARQYANLGVIYKDREELDKAEDMFQKSIKISEQQEMSGLVGANYGNIGLIYQRRGELDKAEEMHFKSLEINEKIGDLLGTACQCGNLGNIYETQGDLSKTEVFWEKARDLFVRMGIKHEVQKLQGLLDELEKHKAKNHSEKLKS